MATADKPAKVLVVDDEENIRELLSVSLKFQGYEVETAADGPRALDAVRTFKPDVLVLDVMMPGMDGFELLTKLRSEGLDGPVLYLTAKDAVENRIHGLTIGADDYVTKPFSLEEVITRLRVILRRGQGREQDTEDAAISYQSVQGFEVMFASRPDLITAVWQNADRYFVASSNILEKAAMEKFIAGIVNIS